MKLRLLSWHYSLLSSSQEYPAARAFLKPHLHHTLFDTPFALHAIFPFVSSDFLPSRTLWRGRNSVAATKSAASLCKPRILKTPGTPGAPIQVTALAAHSFGKRLRPPIFAQARYATAMLFMLVLFSRSRCGPQRFFGVSSDRI